MEKILWALILFWNVENYFAPFDLSEPFPSVGTSIQGNDMDRDSSFSLHSGASGNFFADKAAYGKKRFRKPKERKRGQEQLKKFRNWKAFSHKRDGIAKTLCLVAERFGRFPDLIGLAEVENRWVLNQLAQNTVLAAQDYGIVHRDSPDSRGIDVALLYRRSTFRPLSRRFIPITDASFNSPSDTLLSQKQLAHNENSRKDAHEDTLRTREILYVKGVLRGYDTLHLFVNHWPSKLGGRAAQNHRCEIARKLKWLCDSIAASVEGAGGSKGRQVNAWHGAKIVIMGDFNAGEGDSALKILEGGSDAGLDADGDIAIEALESGNASWERMNSDRAVENTSLLVNMNDGNIYGSYKYKGEWSTIDRFYVSRYFVEDKEISAGKAEIFSHPFLMEEDRTYLGVKPRRSFIGPRFNGGLSDHLPIVLRIFGYQ